MVCTHCQHDNPEGNRYCGECGHVLGAETGPATRYTDQARLVRREAVVVTAGVVLLLAAALGFWWLFYSRTSPQGVVRRFLDADQRGDTQAERALVVSRLDGQLIISLLQAFRQQAGVSAFTRYRVGRATASGDTAAVQVTVYLPQIMPPGRPAPAAASSAGGTPVTFYLVLEDHEWKVDPTQTLMALAAAMASNGMRKLLPPGQPGTGLPWTGFPGAPGGPPNPSASPVIPQSPGP